MDGPLSWRPKKRLRFFVTGLVCFFFVLLTSTLVLRARHHTLLRCYFLFSSKAKLSSQTLRAESQTFSPIDSFLKGNVLCLSWLVCLTSFNLYTCWQNFISFLIFWYSSILLLNHFNLWGTLFFF